MLELTDTAAIIWLLLTIANIVVSMIGFRNRQFFEKYLFSVDRVLSNKEYFRLISSGFLHGSWMHLFFNMLTFYFFGPVLEAYWGSLVFLLLYFVSLIGSDLLSLYIHRHQGHYRSIGASGAVSGMLFSYVILAPDSLMSFLFLPFIKIPAWLFGIIYTIYSIYGMRSQTDNVAHDAHIGGAMAGIVISVILQPELLIERGWLVALLLGGFGLFLWLVVNKPDLMLPSTASTSRFRPERPGKHSEQEVDRRLQEELDELLKKMHISGWDNLTEYEQRRLHYLSDRLRK